MTNSFQKAFFKGARMGAMSSAREMRVEKKKELARKKRELERTRKVAADKRLDSEREKRFIVSERLKIEKEKTEQVRLFYNRGRKK